MALGFLRDREADTPQSAGKSRSVALQARMRSLPTVSLARFSVSSDYRSALGMPEVNAPPWPPAIAPKLPARPCGAQGALFIPLPSRTLPVRLHNAGASSPRPQMHLASTASKRSRLLCFAKPPPERL